MEELFKTLSESTSERKRRKAAREIIHIAVCRGEYGTLIELSGRKDLPEDLRKKAAGAADSAAMRYVNFESNYWPGRDVCFEIVAMVPQLSSEVRQVAAEKAVEWFAKHRNYRELWGMTTDSRLLEASRRTAAEKLINLKSACNYLVEIVYDSRLPDDLREMAAEKVIKGYFQKGDYAAVREMASNCSLPLMVQVLAEEAIDFCSRPRGRPRKDIEEYCGC